MTKIDDLTGRRFGKLTVMERDITKNLVYWICICDCGNTKSAYAGNLKSGNTSHCGCSNKLIKDLTGQKFGRLTVISKGKNKNAKVSWNCICDCNPNKIISVTTTSLTSGNTQSCGCLHKEIIKKTKKPITVYEKDDYAVGVTEKGEEFIFDKDDIDWVKELCCRIGYSNYVITHVNGKDIELHRVIMDAKSNEIVDHINHNTLDNRKVNLRLCSTSENNSNARLRSHNTSGVTGVSWNKRSNKWKAYIQKNYKQIDLGLYENFEEAVSVRKQAQEKYFGEFNYDKSVNTNQVT